MKFFPLSLKIRYIFTSGGEGPIWRPLSARPVSMKLAFLFRYVCHRLFCALFMRVRKREGGYPFEPPAAAPQTILVQTFEFEDDMVRGVRQGEELEQFKRTMEEMTSNLLERIRKYIGPAQAVSSGAEAPRGKAWLLSGRFTRVNQGSRFLRVRWIRQRRHETGCYRHHCGLVGKGSEAIPDDPNNGWVERNARGYRGRVRVAGELHRAHGLLAGLSSDCRRTSREISALAQYMKRHGLQVADDVPKFAERRLTLAAAEKRRGLASGR